MNGSSIDRIELPQFRFALTAHCTALNEITYWRYSRGVLPAFGRSLVEHPDLARALAADAEALAQRQQSTAHDHP